MAKTAKVELTQEQKAAKKEEAKIKAHDAFVRLAEARTTKALAAISVIGNLASPSYNYSEAEAQAIIKVLDNELSILAKRFSKPEASAKSGFSLAAVVAEDATTTA